MTKEKVVDLVSMLPQMDPEVAKQVLAQFPAFAETCVSIVDCLKEDLDRVTGSNEENMREFNAMCAGVLESLKTELARPDLSDEARTTVIEGIIQITNIIAEKDTENKKFLLHVLGVITAPVALVLLCLVSVLGLNIHASSDP